MHEALQDRISVCESNVQIACISDIIESHGFKFMCHCEYLLGLFRFLVFLFVTCFEIVILY